MALPKKIKKDINLLTPKPGINPYLGGGEQFIEQNPAHLALNNAKGQTLGNGCFTNPRFTNQHGIILFPAA